MITITDHVRAWITRHPFHARFMADGLLNASSLARQIRPEIEQQVGERVSAEAVTLALNRHGRSAATLATLDYTRYLGEVSVQSGLSLLTVSQTNLDTDRFLDAVTRLQQDHEYALYTRGVWHTTLIGRHDIIVDLAAKFSSSVKIDNLVAVTIRLKPGHLLIPGVCAYILQRLALRGVNLVETASSYNELTLIINATDMNAALDCLV